MAVVCVGIDCTAGGQSFTYAALDHELRISNLAEADLEELVAFLGSHDAIAVGVNAPSHLNAGIVRRRLEAQKGASSTVRGAEIREAEYELHARGIAINGTPRAEALCPGWVQLGFELYRRFGPLSIKAFPAQGGQRQWLETHPHAGFCALLGRAPLPKPTLEGRLQRGLVLFERGVRIHDPMAFLEEITRHRLLHGLLPMELVLSQEQLDALLAAFTAWLAMERPTEVMQLGNSKEGFITLPVSRLEDKY